MSTSDQFKRHLCGTLNGVFVAASRTKLGVATKWYVFKFITMRAHIHGTTIGWIPAVNHLGDVFHNDIPRMKAVFNYLVIVVENLLQNIHKTIMQEKEAKRNPLIPLMSEGLGELRCRRHFLVLSK